MKSLLFASFLVLIPATSAFAYPSSYQDHLVRNQQFNNGISNRMNQFRMQQDINSLRSDFNRYKIYGSRY